MPVDLNGDGSSEYSFGFNIDSLWMYDLRGIRNGEWPQERLSFHQFPHEVEEVAEIAIPLSIMDRPTSITTRVWVNNAGTAVDEAGPATVLMQPPATETTITSITLETITIPQTEAKSTTSTQLVTGVLLGVALVTIAALAAFYLRRRRKWTHLTSQGSKGIKPK